MIYPGTCRHKRGIVEPCAWRLLVEDDDLRNTVGDFVLRRADGIFTYQLAVVVDDALQGVTHVVRGADLLDNTPRQIYLQKQLGFKKPHYLHLPLVLDENNEKLSKQTLAKAIHTDSAETSLKALQAAAKHRGLRDGGLHEKSPQKLSKWLEIAIENYKGLLKAD